MAAIEKNVWHMRMMSFTMYAIKINEEDKDLRTTTTNPFGMNRKRGKKVSVNLQRKMEK